MFKTIIKSATVAAILVGSTAGAFAQSSYHGKTTHYPYSGFYGVGKHSAYCDYIKYPKRYCTFKKVYSYGKWITKRSCRTVGWEYRQSCY